jgi:hypothetical protein
MSKNYIVLLKLKENPQIHNTSHGTINTKTATKKILKIFLCISFFKNYITCGKV